MKKQELIEKLKEQESWNMAEAKVNEKMKIDGGAFYSRAEGYRHAIKLAKELEKPKECEWTYDERCDCYNTKCGTAYCMNAGDYKENEYNFCPKCGGVIKEGAE